MKHSGLIATLMLGTVGFSSTALANDDEGFYLGVVGLQCRIGFGVAK